MAKKMSKKVLVEKEEKKTTKTKKKEEKKEDNIVEEMKNLGDKNKKPMISPINRFNILFVDLQILFTIITIICLIWYLFNPKLWYFLQGFLGITMIIIGYNNYIIYNKPKMSYVYYGIGAILLIFDLLLILGV